MTSLHGLPPLPKSLSGINLFEATSKSSGLSVASTSLNPVDEVEQPRYRSFPNSKPGSSSKGPPLPPTRTFKNGVQQDQPPPIRPRKTGLDAQLSILRKEMYGLRQLDLSLLSQLWTLNESIQEFRQLLQEQEEQALSPPSPSSADEGDEFYSPLTQPRMPANLHPGLHPVPEQFRLTSSSSQSSIEYGDV